MKLSIDSVAGTLVDDQGKTLPLYSAEGFALLSKLWLKVG